MQDLIETIPTGLRVALLVVSGVATLWLIGELGRTMAPADDVGGSGIVAFELAGTPARATDILGGWGEDGRAAAVAAIKLDYVFLVAYSVFLSLACATVAMMADGYLGQWFESAGWWLAGLVLVAGLLDAIENTALLRVIDGFDAGSISGVATAVAAGAAAVKFVIVIAALLYAALGLALLAKRAAFD